MHKGKIIGGILGFCLGGPLGGLCGYLIGRSYDRQVAQGLWNRNTETDYKAFSAYEEQSAFAIGVIILSAKMARADGRVTKAEIDAFRKVFEIKRSREGPVALIFNQARVNPDGFEPYAHRLAQIFADRPTVLEGILSALFIIGEADAPLSQREMAFLEQVSAIFGFDAQTFFRIAAQSGVRLGAERPRSEQQERPQPAAMPECYAILGVMETTSAAEIKAAYRSLIREHHPDRLMAQGVPAEYIAAATEKMKRINAAYDAICKLKGIA